jgi:hypothetical protein
MAMDLVTGANQPSVYHFLYAHATLQRLFRPASDGRQQFFSQVPGLVNWTTRAQMQLTNFSPQDVLVDHYLLEFPSGWVNILGGTKGLAWFQHYTGLWGLPNPAQSLFPSYYFDLAQTCLADIATAIPAGDQRPILFNGHSLGGASSVAAAFFDGERIQPRTARVISFGSPKTRYKQGMDGRDFQHWRCVNELDLVPYASFSLIPIPKFLIPGKMYATSLFHYGQEFRVTQDFIFHTLPLNGAIMWAPFVAGTAFAETGNPVRPHYMESYAFLLRRQMSQLAIPIDPIWDQINDYINRTEGWGMNIPGFPVSPGPALPDGFTPPAETLDIEELLEEGIEGTAAASPNMLDDSKNPNILRGQSLAAYLNGQFGRAFTNVNVRLARQPVPDPNDIGFGDLIECDFEGYEPRGGSVWATTAAAPGTGASQLFACRVGFRCDGSNPANTVYYCYLTATEAGNPQDVLLAAYPLQGGVLMHKRGQNLVFDVYYGVGAS